MSSSAIIPVGTLVIPALSSAYSTELIPYIAWNDAVELFLIIPPVVANTSITTGNKNLPLVASLIISNLNFGLPATLLANEIYNFQLAAPSIGVVGDNSLNPIDAIYQLWKRIIVG